MRKPLALLVAAAAALGVAAPAAAQTRGTVLPDRAALDRLDLRTEWTAYVPVDSGRDAFGTVQVADENQIFVQTRSGLLVALDAASGAKQWTFRYPAGYVNLYPVGWNDDFVFAVNIARLYCFHRYTGVVAFDYEMPGAATAGPAADRDYVYVTLDGTRLVAYLFPPLLAAGPRATAAGGAKPVNVAEVVAGRYVSPGAVVDPRAGEFEAARVPFERSTESGLNVNQRTPSISALPSATPPYTLDNRGLFGSPSVAVLPTLRQPYQFRPDFLRYNQRTPSVSVLPPSIARVYELANFRPRGIEPTVAWVHTSGRRYVSQPVLTDREGGAGEVRANAPVRRVWLTTDGADVVAADRLNGLTQVLAPLQDRAVTPMAGPVALAADRLLGFVGLQDGNVVALDLLRGGDRGPKTEWRASVGGLMNHPPVATRDAVFASGAQSGVARIDIDTGDVVWKTSDESADRVLAVNDEYVYVRDRRGDLLVYDRRSPTDPAARRSNPLARAPVAGFGVPVTNDRTDRIILASDGGTMVCLRGSAGKYAKASRLIPKLPAVAAKQADIPPEPKKDAPPVDPKKAAPVEPKKAAPAPGEPKKDAPAVPKKGGV